jgi:hypothetical protein
VTEIVGNNIADILPLKDTPDGPWKVYSVARRPQPMWNIDNPIHYIQYNVSNQNDVELKLATTNVFH